MYTILECVHYVHRMWTSILLGIVYTLCPPRLKVHPDLLSPLPLLNNPSPRGFASSDSQGNNPYRKKFSDILSFSLKACPSLLSLPFHKLLRPTSVHPSSIVSKFQIRFPLNICNKILSWFIFEGDIFRLFWTH